MTPNPSKLLRRGVMPLLMLLVMAAITLVVVVGLVLLAPVLFLLFMELSSQAGMVAMFLVVPLILVYLLVELVLSAVSGGRTIRDRLSKTRVINIRSEEAKALDLKMRRSSAAEQWSAPAA
jgi:membrane protein implicated in regulation of membrane protease activity